MQLKFSMISFAEANEKLGREDGHSSSPPTSARKEAKVLKKKLLVAFMLMAVSAVFIGGSTYAWFTDSDAITGNTFSTGTVVMTTIRDNGEYVPGPLFYTTAEEGKVLSGPSTGELGLYPTGLWMPGMSATRNLTVTSSGSLAARVCRIGATLTGDTAFMANQDARDEFAINLRVKVTSTSGGNQTLLDRPLAELLADGGAACDVKKIIGANGSSQNIDFTCSLSTNAGNSLQGQKPVVSFYLIAEQVANNP